MKKTICVFTTFLLLITNTRQFDLETCRHPIGIETGKISDAAFTASSFRDSNTIASNARIRSEKIGWCPLNKISSTTYEYIEIDLVNLTVITLIEIQGKFSLIPNDQYADAFRIEYRREIDKQWIEYKDFSGQYMLSGSSNSYIPTIRDILPAIIARQIRIIPIVTGPIGKHICMRLELYGCYYQDGLVSYSMPQGDRRGYDVQFVDETYDGQNDNRMLKDGLGQLTDGVLGDHDYRVTNNLQSLGKIGYDWIGWHRKSLLKSNAIKIHFFFDTMKNFSSIRIHTSNLFTRDIYIFQSIIITCCDRKYNSQIQMNITTDDEKSDARFIEIPLNNQNPLICNCLSVLLTFHNKSQWILISEVEFNSLPVSIDSSNASITTYFIDYDISINHYWYLIFLSSCLLLFLTILFILICYRSKNSRKYSNGYYNIKNHLKFDTNFYTNNSNDSYLSSMSTNDIPHNFLISTTDSSKSINYSSFSPLTLSTVYQSSINPYRTVHSNTVPNVRINPYESVDKFNNMKFNETNAKLKNLQGPCGNSTYECLSQPYLTIPTLTTDQIIIGQTYSTENKCFGIIYHGYLYVNQNDDNLKPILIKILTTNDKFQKDLFDKEHSILNRLNHPNIVAFYGYTNERNYAIIEHTDYGDVYSYLSISRDTSKNIRLHIIIQLSNALRYLESQNIIHRDISARNCLLYPNNLIKLTNTAIASEQFELHYYEVNSTKLPIRWMAPESVANNQFTLQSDIWSFGITLWEIMTNCLTLPYGLLNDNEIYERLKFSNGLFLSKPESFNKELIDLMLECWRPINERPTFGEIYMFFNKRLDGMNIN